MGIHIFEEIFCETKQAILNERISSPYTFFVFHEQIQLHVSTDYAESLESGDTCFNRTDPVHVLCSYQLWPLYVRDTVSQNTVCRYVCLLW